MGYHSNADNKFIDDYKTNISFEGKNETKIEYKNVFASVRRQLIGMPVHI